MGPENYLRCSTAKGLGRMRGSCRPVSDASWLAGTRRKNTPLIEYEDTSISAALAFVSAAYAAAPAQPRSDAAAQPAEWLQHDLIVSLHNLPRTYSCNDLWYKFRDVLLAIGARADYKILPYDCGSRSPQVQLNFMLPQALSPCSAAIR